MFTMDILSLCAVDRGCRCHKYNIGIDPLSVMSTHVYDHLLYTKCALWLMVSVGLGAWVVHVPIATLKYKIATLIN